MYGAAIGARHETARTQLVEHGVDIVDLEVRRRAGDAVTTVRRQIDVVVPPAYGREAWSGLVALAPPELRPEHVRIERKRAFDVGAVVDRNCHDPV